MSRQLDSVCKAVMAATALALCSVPVYANVIVDQDVENDGDWDSSNLFPSQPWNSSGFGVLVPGFQEGTQSAVFQNNDSIALIAPSFTGMTVQEGAYTVEFALGNYSNAPLPAIQLDFAGLGAADSLTLTPNPVPSGGWSLLSASWVVGAGDANIGNAFSFLFSTTDALTSNLAFDGVGNLSGEGDGFLVHFDAPAAAPEPATIALLGIGLAGIGFRPRKKLTA